MCPSLHQDLITSWLMGKASSSQHLLAYGIWLMGEQTVANKSWHTRGRVVLSESYYAAHYQSYSTKHGLYQQHSYW
jgi:hypothetical protein